MKNMKKFLALSLLLSIPSMKYAMEDNAGFQGLNSSTEKVAEGVSTSVATPVVESAAGQSWFSNPMTWNRPSMPDLGLQARWSAFNEGYVAPAVQSASSGLSTLNENYVTPGMQKVSSGLQTGASYLNESVGKPVWNATAYALQGAGSRLQTAGDYMHENALQPSYELGAQGWNSGSQMIGQGSERAAQFLAENPQAAGLGLMAAAMGAWALYRYNNPSLTNPTEQKNINRFVEDFKAKNADEIARIQAEIEAKQAAQANRTWSEYAAGFYPSSFPSWGSKVKTIQDAAVTPAVKSTSAIVTVAPVKDEEAKTRSTLEAMQDVTPVVQSTATTVTVAPVEDEEAETRSTKAEEIN